MPTVLMLIPFSPGMESAGFHSYEEAEEEHIPFTFSNSASPVSSDDSIRPDVSDEKE